MLSQAFFVSITGILFVFSFLGVLVSIVKLMSTLVKAVSSEQTLTQDSVDLCAHSRRKAAMIAASAHHYRVRNQEKAQ